ncbi:ATP-binding protein [Curtobacterium sp. MCSS17_016]|uniref:ATP-binding protein n=1 Tax=Curtobacterium sp. MCSS17_016 TaxID=2175644 RepID=UPI000DA9AD55|nr:ATP-binding protein [Curtobacterium sp. MCSS17_016]WIE80945.1 ATP-binding protein [Curtobacterium sp. MCSS17_016]
MANTRPDYPTMVAGRMQDGRLIGVDQSVWLYKKVPLAPVTEAKTTERALVAALPLVNAYESLAQMTPVRSNRRALTRAQYRDTHALLVNIPTAYRPTPSDIDAYLAEQYAGERVYNRFLLFGVKLQSTVGDGGFQAAINSVTQTLLEGGTPISDYDKDFRQVDQALTNAGLQSMTAADFRMANSWWNQGQFPDTPTLFHSDHMHVFGSAEATSIVQQIGPDQCEAWPPLSDTSTVTFASVQDLDLPFVDAGTSTAQWISPYIRADASIVSIRALVEPSKVTRDELRRNRKQNMDDLNERMREQKMDRAELDEKIETLEAVENGYASGGGPATLVDASILMAFDGRIEDMSEMSSVNVTLNAMLYRQKSAWAETMLCSNVRTNPNRHDLPDTTIAYSGLPSLSTVGDTSGAMVGFTESDRQPALLSPTAVAQEDRTPICVVAAASGAGKSMMMLWLADQFARMGRPCVIIDPKTGSDHSGATNLSGGQVASLDDFISSDGVLDPLRFAITRQDGVDMAASMILSVNPFGNNRNDAEVPLISALNYGVGHGATCIGQALLTAVESDPQNQMWRFVYGKVLELANASSQFRAMVGFEPGTEALRIADGITLIKVGKTSLNLPTPGTTAEQQNISQRVSLALVRMMIFGAATALTGRDGVIFQDEAWTILNSDPKEVERLGRLARSQRVLPILFSQDISGAANAGLAGYISRGFVGPITDEKEALAAMELFGIEPTPERMARVTASATMDAYGNDEYAAPNYNSMKALRDPRTRKVLRGSVWMYSDLSGRVIPVECVIPPEFLRVASTNALDIDAREKAASMGQAA